MSSRKRKRAHYTNPVTHKLNPPIQLVSELKNTRNKLPSLSKHEKFEYSEDHYISRAEIFKEKIKKDIPNTPIPLPSNQLLDIINNLTSYKSQDAPHLVESMRSNTLLAFGIAVQEYMIYLMEPLVKDTIKMNIMEMKRKKKEEKDKD